MPWSMSTYTRAFISRKNKVARNEKRKNLHGFSYIKSMANFEAFCWNFSSSTNPQIVRITAIILKIKIAEQLSNDFTKFEPFL